MSAQILWWALAGMCVVGALSVITVRELTRMVVGLGVFLLGVAGFYAYYGFELLAVAELFVYVGGVLVLFLFAISSMGRDREGRAIARSFDVGAAVTSVVLALVLAVALSGLLPSDAAPAVQASVERTGGWLLSGLMPQFEVAGVVLLAALSSALAIVAGGDRR